MKLAILGGAGMRTPVFIQSILGLSHDMVVDEVVLMDVDEDRLEPMGFLVQEITRRAGNPFKVTLSVNASEALAGADFVVSAIRVGGLKGRAIDESVPLSHSVVGQETTGPGGFCMGLRTIPVVLEYVKTMQRLAPNAWFINFTNPSGMITQAVASYGETDRVIGVCDSPAAMFHRVAVALGIGESEAYFDYFGLNHLGWLRGVYAHGKEVLASILARLGDPAVRERVECLDEIALFGVDLIEALGMIPNEYLYYYYYNRQAVENVKKARETRAQFLLRTTGDVIRRLEAARAAGDPTRALDEYNRYMELRHRMYMKMETSAGFTPDTWHQALGGGREPTAAREDGGYGRIALEVIRAIVQDFKQVMVLNTENRGAVEGLAADRIVEVPCVVDANGVHPLAVGRVPGDALGLMQIVGEYERLTIEAAVTGSYLTAWRALAVHPLVPSASVARQILDEYLQRHGGALAHIRWQR